jgi:hypothetical protein
MAWQTTRLETHTLQRLSDEHAARGLEFFAEYEATRTQLVESIFGEIKGIQPDLSDHGPDHIANVQENAYQLLSDHHDLHKLKALDLYCLGMAILFHDVGNLFGRKHHQKEVGKVFDWARGTDAKIRHERTLILRLAGAHTGTATDGTSDTLKEVNEKDHLYGEGVQLRSIAAILRFADELAEGPQRTSEFAREHGLIKNASKIYHEYASVTNIRADRGTQRIQVSYEIPLQTSDITRWQKRGKQLSTLLRFVYARVVKLDQERRYNRFYSEALLPFRSTEVTFMFHSERALLDVDLPPLVLDDKVVPGDRTKTVPQIDSHYEITTLTQAVLKQLKKAGRR